MKCIIWSNCANVWRHLTKTQCHCFCSFFFHSHPKIQLGRNVMRIMKNAHCTNFPFRCSLLMPKHYAPKKSIHSFKWRGKRQFIEYQRTAFKCCKNCTKCRLWFRPFEIFVLVHTTSYPWRISISSLLFDDSITNHFKYPKNTFGCAQTMVPQRTMIWNDPSFS